MVEPFRVDVKRRATVAVQMTAAPVTGDGILHDAIIAGLRAAIDAFEAEGGKGDPKIEEHAYVPGAPTRRWVFTSRDAAGNEASFIVDVTSQFVPEAPGVQAGILDAAQAA